MSDSELANINEERDQRVGGARPPVPFVKWFDEHPVWTILVAIILLLTFMTTILLYIGNVENGVGDVHTNVRELRDDMNEVRGQIGEINGEIGYIKGRLDGRWSAQPESTDPVTSN